MKQRYIHWVKLLFQESYGRRMLKAASTDVIGVWLVSWMLEALGLARYTCFPTLGGAHTKIGNLLFMGSENLVDGTE